jgi:hypothetical protein
MNRRDLFHSVMGLAVSTALPPPELGFGGPIYNITPAPTDFIDALGYTQIFRRTVEITATRIISKLPPDLPWCEIKQPAKEWWNDELVERDDVP